MAISAISRASGFKSTTSKIVTNRPSIQKSMPLKAGRFKLNGAELTISSADNLESITRKINRKTYKSGIKAEVNKTSRSSHQLILTSKREKVVIQDKDGVFARLREHNKIGTHNNSFIKLQTTNKSGRVEFIYDLVQKQESNSNDILQEYLRSLLSESTPTPNNVIDFSKGNIAPVKPNGHVEEDDNFIPDIELPVIEVEDDQINPALKEQIIKKEVNENEEILEEVHTKIPEAVLKEEVPENDGVIESTVIFEDKTLQEIIDKIAAVVDDALVIEEVLEETVVEEEPVTEKISEVVAKLEDPVVEEEPKAIEENQDPEVVLEVPIKEAPVNPELSFESDSNEIPYVEEAPVLEGSVVKEAVAEDVQETAVEEAPVLEGSAVKEAVAEDVQETAVEEEPVLEGSAVKEAVAEDVQKTVVEEEPKAIEEDQDPEVVLEETIKEDVDNSELSFESDSDEIPYVEEEPKAIEEDQEHTLETAVIEEVVDKPKTEEVPENDGVESTVIFEETPLVSDYLEESVYTTEDKFETIPETRLKADSTESDNNGNNQELLAESEPFSPLPIELSHYEGINGVQDDLVEIAEVFNESFNSEDVKPLSPGQTAAIKEVIDSPSFSPIPKANEDPEPFMEPRANHSYLLQPDQLRDKLESGAIKVQKYDPTTQPLTKLDALRQSMAYKATKLQTQLEPISNVEQINESKQEVSETTVTNVSKIDDGNDPLNSSMEIQRILQKIKNEEEKLDYSGVIREFVTLANSKKPQDNQLRRETLVSIKKFVEARESSLQSKDPELYSIFAKHQTKVKNNDKYLFDKASKNSLEAVAAYVRAYCILSTDRVHLKPFIPAKK